MHYFDILNFTTLLYVLQSVEKRKPTTIARLLTLGGVVLAARSKLVALPAGLYCGESLKSAGELAAEPLVPPLLSTKHKIAMK